MLDWKIINGLNNNYNYCINVSNGVDLPKVNEEVLFCRNDYRNIKKDIYFSGHIYENKYGLSLVNSSTGGVESLVDGIYWTRFNMPKTINNTGYAIAYVDKNGNNFEQDIPYIIRVSNKNIFENIEKLKKKGYSKITVFDYIEPCSFEYNWDYIIQHKLDIQKDQLLKD